MRSGTPVQVVVAAPLEQSGPRAAPLGAVAVTANGYVVARTRAAVAAKIPGRLAVLSVSEGSYVQRGAIIARLENDDYAAAVAEARANVGGARAQLAESETERDQLQRDAARLQQIRAGNASLTAQQEVELAESRATQAAARATTAAARVEAAVASLQFAEASLENTIIRAPFTGTVLRKEAEVGEVVAPSVGGGLTRGAVVTMADLTTLEVEVDVNEAYIGRVQHGQDARITLDAYPDTAFRGRVRQVVPTADRQRATVQVKVSIVDRDARILPEMGARVDFVAAQSPADVDVAGSAASAPPRFRLPQDAVRTVAGRSVVWVVRDGRLVSREVDAGPVSAGFREIRRGLVGGEQVLVAGVSDPAAGMKVRVIP
ncbi:MAG: efflux RND transporter periplasmic adaptor subunit [Gemmatimonadaceae bacterium]|nr:efflux RND transporter periplasmic adaptor subunit [Gemmatimonadaceae bacterium]MCW5827301.1 efflux RND transporter periplasmic adaptor subunit [Gemmatimonadaceae bacterium]